MHGFEPTEEMAALELAETRRRLRLPDRPITLSEARFPRVTTAEFVGEAKRGQLAAAAQAPATAREQRSAALQLAKTHLAAGRLDECRRCLELAESCGGCDVGAALRDLARRTPLGLTGAEMVIERAIQQDRRANGGG